jgi:hypothetical protein
MTTCLKYCTPIAAAMFAGAMLWQLAFPGGVVRGLSRPAGEIREGWLEGPGGLSRGRGKLIGKSAAAGSAEPLTAPLADAKAEARIDSQNVVQVVP